MTRSSEEVIAEKLSGLSGWVRAGEAIAKTYTFDTFLGGIDFVNQVAGIAEEVDHHPDIAINYHRVTFTLWTHSAGGLTEKDFSLAHQIEEAYQDSLY